MTHPILTLFAAFAMMGLCWLLSLMLRDVSIVDILWAPAFAIVAGVCAAASAGIETRGWAMLALVSIWAARLGSHILSRRLRLGHEDYRYAAFRQRGGAGFPMKSLLSIFGLQALLLWIVSWPLQALFDSAKPLNGADAIGGVLALLGIAIEAVADMQLTRFCAVPENRERVMAKGLWGLSRHPNYFGDFVLWWGIYIVALASGAPWWTIVGPAVMSALLLHYSGVGLMEETIVERRPGYRDYIRRTSVFFPWPARPDIAKR